MKINVEKVFMTNKKSYNCDKLWSKLGFKV